MNRRVLWPVVLLFTSILVLCVSAIKFAAADSSSAADWFTPIAPATKKLFDLQSSVAPQLANFDCTPVTLTAFQTTTDPGTSKQDCEVDSSLGSITTGSRIITDSSHAYDLVGPSNHSSIWPVPNSSLLTELIPSSSTGDFLGFYNSVHRSDVSKQLVNNITYTAVNYKINKLPDLVLKSQGNNLAINPFAMAYSKNGEWLVIDMPRSALLRVNLETMQIMPFANSIEQPSDLGLDGAGLAISNDGRYVALSQNISGVLSLNLYDLANCSGTIKTTSLPGAVQCRSRDLWRGQFAVTGQGNDLGIRSVFPTLSQLGDLRFVDDYQLSFNAIYDQLSGANFKTGVFVVTAFGGSEHNLGFLGMGDSYISGEGEFDYQSGTDTAVNKCHLSPLSYPYLLGKLYFGSYKSIACSGAVTTDITALEDAYTGQGAIGRVENNINKSEILSMFTPGYLPQHTFSESYKPEAIVLSIGGNNVGFSNIIKSCIEGITDQSTCYATYQDRLNLLHTINGSYNDLVKTYTAVKAASPGTRIYVVGYPQIVKPDGDCADNVHLNGAETEFAQELINDLDKVIQRAAANAGVFYVDTQDSFNGFRLCEGKPGAIAMNGFTVGKDSGITIPILNKTALFIGQESYHPNQLGHQLLESTIATQTEHLTASMPVPQPSLQAPQIDPADPLLADLPPVQSNPLAIIADDHGQNDYVQTGANIALNIEGLINNLSPLSVFHLTLHSNPIDLGTVTSDTDGNIHTTLTIPSNTLSGLHTIRVTGKDFAGNDIDIQKQIYVINPAALANNGYCQVVPDSGHDVDQDGIDDACDPEIGPVPIVSQEPANVSSDSQTTESITQQKDITDQQQISDVSNIQSAFVGQGLFKFGTPTPTVQGAVPTSSFTNNSIEFADSKLPREPTVLGDSTGPALVNKPNVHSNFANTKSNDHILIIALGSVFAVVFVILFWQQFSHKAR